MCGKCTSPISVSPELLRRERLTTALPIAPPTHPLPCRLTDSQGRVVSFKNTLIVLTTNVGSSVIAKGGQGIGFELRGEAESAEEAKYTRIRGLVMEELKVGGAGAGSGVGGVWG